MTNLHQQLAEAQRALRDAEDTFKLVKAKAEQDAIVNTNGDYGKNERDRERGASRLTRRWMGLWTARRCAATSSAR